MLRRLINSIEAYLFTNTEQMENTTKSLELLTRGFSKDLAEYIYESDKFVELLHDLTAEFVETNIPIVDEDAKYDLGMMMLDTVVVESRV